MRYAYFKWRDPEIYVYGQRVVSKLRDWHENLKALKAEHEQSRINRLEEVEKYNNEVEKCRAKAEKYKFKLRR